MSSDGLYALRYRDGKEADFPRSIAENIFSRGAINFDPSFGLVEWIDGEAEIHFGDEETMCVVYSARYIGLTYLERLYELAAEVGLAILWLDDVHDCFVTDQTVIGHLPPNILELKPVVVDSAREMIDLMNGTWINPDPHHRIA